MHQLDTLTQSLAFIIDDHGIPEIIYWGPRLFEKLPSTAGSLTRKPLPDSKLVEYTPVSILPEYGRGFFGHPGLEGHRGSTQWATQFRMLRRGTERGPLHRFRGRSGRSTETENNDLH